MSKKYRKRGDVVCIYVSEEEKELIKSKSHDCGFGSVNDYARKMLIDGQVFVVDMDPVKDLRKEFRKIGINLNQAIKLAKTQNDGLFGSEDVVKIKECITNLDVLNEKIKLMMLIGK